MLYCLVKDNYLGRLRDTYVGDGSGAIGLLHKDFIKYSHGREVRSTQSCDTYIASVDAGT